jgi:hypothetical protein
MLAQVRAVPHSRCSISPRRCDECPPRSFQCQADPPDRLIRVLIRVLGRSVSQSRQVGRMGSAYERLPACLVRSATHATPPPPRPARRDVAQRPLDYVRSADQMQAGPTSCRACAMGAEGCEPRADTSTVHCFPSTCAHMCVSLRVGGFDSRANCLPIQALRSARWIVDTRAAGWMIKPVYPRSDGKARAGAEHRGWNRSTLSGPSPCLRR